MSPPQRKLQYKSTYELDQGIIGGGEGEGEGGREGGGSSSGLPWIKHGTLA
jgi:hypothetical protein